jgi:hypothetical protein
MRYKITITRETKKQVPYAGKWQVLGVEYATEDELHVMDSERRKEYKRDSEGNHVRQVYGYPPTTMTEETALQEIYSQIVDELDVSSVISAVLSNSSTTKE